MPIPLMLLGSALFKWAKIIPWQIWVAGGCILAVLFYGHVREKRGFEKCRVQVVDATKKEEARRVEAANESAAEAQSRASESAQRAKALEGELDATQKEVSRLKNAKTVCIPKSITDRYQRGGVQQKRGSVPGGSR